MSAKKQPRVISYTDDRLSALGISSKDISTKVKIFRIDAYEQEKLLEEVTIQRITSGTFGQRWDIIDGPDMVFHYVTLDRRTSQYLRDPKSSKLSTFRRVRFSNPGLHLDQYGRPMKYQSPPNSGIHLWMPEKVIEMYEKQKQYDTLYIIEGELKAEMGAKFGMPMVGIGGIQNLAGKDQQLPKEFEMMIKHNGIKKVCFITDSDCFDLAQDLQDNPTKRADGRPWAFFAAVNNFREYFHEFSKVGLDLELFFAHINPGREKGLDDLMSGSAKGHEIKIEGELRKLMAEKVRKDDDGIAKVKGDWVTVYPLTDVPKSQVKKIWALQDAAAFAKRYAAELIPIGKFTFYKDGWKIDDQGRIELAQPILPEEKFWCHNDGGKVQFDYIGITKFLGNRHYGRFAYKPNDYIFVHTEGRVVEKVETWQIKDFVTDFTERIGLTDVLQLLYKGGKSYLGPETLGNCKFLDIHFSKSLPNSQFLYFRNEFWEVTASGTKKHSTTELPHYIWKDSIRDFDVTLATEPLVKFKDVPNGWVLQYSEAGRHFDLLSFLYLTSEYAWRERVKNQGNPAWQYSREQIIEHQQSLASKLTAIGYMLHRFANPSMRKAVIGMDVKNSEVGASQGRSGKSLIGVIMEKMLPTVYIDGKNKKLTEDQFLFEEVEPSTGLIWIDDLRANFDFESFFGVITGKITINKKGQGKFKVADDQVLKLYMSTNHAILGDGSSFADRQIMLGFGDYFNDKHKPADEFGRLFFDEWEQADWNDFYNLMACCLQMYFEKGVIQAPAERLEKRKLRQELGEDFLGWAEKFFGDKSKLNQKLERKEVQEEVEREVKAAKIWQANTIKKKLIAYCKYAGLHFNPNKPDEQGNAFDVEKCMQEGTVHIGISHKSNGLEFFTFGDNNYTPPTSSPLF